MTVVDFALGGVTLPRPAAYRALLETFGQPFADLVVGPTPLGGDDDEIDTSSRTALLDTVRPGAQLVSISRSYGGTRRLWVGLMIEGLVHSYLVDREKVVVGPGVVVTSFIESLFGPFGEAPIADDPDVEADAVGSYHHGVWTGLAAMAHQPWFRDGTSATADELLPGCPLDADAIAGLVDAEMLVPAGDGTYRAGPLLLEFGPSLSGERLTVQASEWFRQGSDRTPATKVLRLLRHRGRWHALMPSQEDLTVHTLVPVSPETVLFFVHGLVIQL